METILQKDHHSGKRMKPPLPEVNNCVEPETYHKALDPQAPYAPQTIHRNTKMAGIEYGATSTKIKTIVMKIRDYYTRDQYAECLAAWNSLTRTEQSQHILACTPFRAQVIQAQETLRQEQQLQRVLATPGWPHVNTGETKI